VLAVMKLFVSPAKAKQFSVSASFDDLSVFDHKDLVSALDGAEPVSDDKSGPACTKVPEAVADHGFTFAIEAGGSLV
jgi:hypothetical protein